jgi:hypothetical protein
VLIRRMFFGYGVEITIEKIRSHMAPMGVDFS